MEPSEIPSRSPLRQLLGSVLRVPFWFLVFVVGFCLGAYLFSHTQRRPLVDLSACSTTHCLNQKELAGLLASAGVLNVPEVLSNVVLETDKTIALNYPTTDAPVHYLIVPKKDIKNVGELSPDTLPYLDDSYAVIAQLVKQHNLKNYRVVTNGPGFQDVSYLHFHLLAY